MEVELYVDPNAPGYIDFVEDLKSELAALKGLDYSVGGLMRFSEP
jgi:hypothetical protein